MTHLAAIIAFGKDQAPKFNAISISGYHIREAGSTATQVKGRFVCRRDLPGVVDVFCIAALGMESILLYNLQGIGKHGAGYIKQFMGPMLAVAVIIFPVEIISHLVRAVSLGLRLFGNVYGEHTVSGSITNIAAPFTYLLAPWPVMLIGIIAATMQTFIFIMLFMVYVGGALAEEH